MKIKFGDFNAKSGRQNIFKLTIWNESTHKDNYDNGIRIVNFATTKYLLSKSTMFPHRKVHNYTWPYPDGKTHDQNVHMWTGDGILVY